ncbi:MAG: acetate/propionate family kinase [Defluviimonas sp.]|nr:acetate/propionate family kinase [Defluviimonas sp.]
MTPGMILTLNAGSSSLKFAVYEPGQALGEVARGQVASIGTAAAELTLAAGGQKQRQAIGRADHEAALRAILAQLSPLLGGRAIGGVGHRIVHGGTEHAAPALLTPGVMAYLDTLAPLAPLHQPHNLAAVRAAMAAFPASVQVGCFDTGFHRGHPWVNDTFALPRRYYDRGVRRYGFHGLSYDHVSHELARTRPELAAGRVIIAHLGNGASMCALREGRSIGSTMGFSALDGLPMGTRCGQLDPGVVLWLMQSEGMGAAQIENLLYRESGLKGLSGLSHDMRRLEAAGTPEAAEAIDYFVFRTRREIGAMAAILGGLDALVFCGGIGENSVTIRARLCEGMDWLGLTLDGAANAAGAAEIGHGSVRVLVIPTDEERVIARAVNAALQAA